MQSRAFQKAAHSSSAPVRFIHSLQGLGSDQCVCVRWLVGVCYDRHLGKSMYSRPPHPLIMLLIIWLLVLGASCYPAAAVSTFVPPVVRLSCTHRSASPTHGFATRMWSQGRNQEGAAQGQRQTEGPTWPGPSVSVGLQKVLFTVAEEVVTISGDLAATSAKFLFVVYVIDVYLRSSPEESQTEITKLLAAVVSAVWKALDGNAIQLFILFTLYWWLSSVVLETVFAKDRSQ
ncbi:unnamed protein product [Vitrella brassicaformis CCMP3155]|uniref:Uncharacterized protein n=1 Tax=Vitrella brassicaformis (strain CCMP3155) TaxID=1169540 RepID=A0A0G4FMT6_VITBC|nr:unnamed protein product [Vitrella brassicaformis CCMP3155]|eukprot:CEM15564.1 unnamed protein product [Vitrella brassicaformis CCMP3155]